MDGVTELTFVGRGGRGVREEEGGVWEAVAGRRRPSGGGGTRYRVRSPLTRLRS